MSDNPASMQPFFSKARLWLYSISGFAILTLVGWIAEEWFASTPIGKAVDDGEFSRGLQMIYELASPTLSFLTGPFGVGFILGATLVALPDLWKIVARRRIIALGPSNELDGRSMISPQSLRFERDLPLRDAIFYIPNRRWDQDRDYWRHQSGLDGTFDPILMEIVQRAYDGDLPLWGKPKDEAGCCHVEIRKAYWSTGPGHANRIVPISMWEIEKSCIRVARSDTTRPDKSDYFDLMTSKEAIRRLWPVG